MQLKALNLKDFLNLIIVILYSYFLLNIFTNPTIETYERAALMEMNRKMVNQAINLSIFLGIVFVSAMYLISRMVFKQSESSAFVSSLLMISSYSFINNFGGISDLYELLHGKFTVPAIQMQNLTQVLPLLPLSLLSLFLIYSKKKMKYLFTGIVALAASFVMPLITLPFLFILNADGISKINKIKDRSKLSTITGGLISAVITFIILGNQGSGILALALSIFVGIIISVVMLAFENKHILLHLLTVMLVMTSLIYAAAYLFNMKRVDVDTLQVMDWIKELEEKESYRIAFASIYGENISKISYVESGKYVSSNDAFLFIFTNRSPSVDYLLLDLFVLDAAKEYANSVNATISFETFAFAGIQKHGETYYQTFISYKNSYLLIPTDSAGNLISNRVIINGAEDSYFKLLLLNSSTNPSYIRYIHPRSDSNKNIFKILYPEQFGTLPGYEIKEIKRSNNSRFILYQIIKRQ